MDDLQCLFLFDYVCKSMVSGCKSQKVSTAMVFCAM